jgi:serine protease
LQAGSRPFPASSDPTVPICRVPSGSFDVQATECVCTTETCGAGLLDADAAVRNALRPAAAPRASGTLVSGQTVVLDGAGSVAACGRSIVRHAWTIVSGTGAIADADRAMASITAPAEGSTVVRLTVEDDRGDFDSAELEITPDSSIAHFAAPLPGTTCPADISIAQVPDDGGAGGGGSTGGGGGPVGGGPQPGSGGGGGGGGGGVDPGWLLFVLLAIARRRASAAN